MSPALVGRFFTTEPPGTPCTYMFLCYISQYFPRFNTFEIKKIYIYIHTHTHTTTSFKELLRWLSGKESTCNAGGARDTGSISGSGRSSGGGNSIPFQYSCLENSIDRGSLWAAVHGVTKSQTRLSGHRQQLKNVPKDISPNWNTGFPPSL